MSMLEVPGARLHYEVEGSGPVMLLIPGATGSAYSFKKLTEHPAANRTVVTYDRRGFSLAGSRVPKTVIAATRKLSRGRRGAP